MMVDFPRYDNYKSSGVSWIGDIPHHWQTAPGLMCYEKRKELNKGMVEDTVLSISYGRIVIRPPEKLTGLVPESFETYQLVNPGDIIIRTTDLQNDWNTLRTAIARDKGIITSAYLRLKAIGDMNPEYLRLVLHTYDLLKVYYGMGSGLRQNLDYNGDFKRLPIIVPPRTEQDRIVAFLDEKTAVIDDTITKKRRLLELLQEQKAILINNAVTKGLNPDALMKESGVEWIGQIPAHWEVKRIKYLFEEVDNRTTTGKETLFSLRMYDGLVPHDEVSNRPITDNDLVGYKIVRPGQFVMNRMRATVGLFAIVSQEGLVSPDYAIFEIASEIDAHFYLYLFKTSLMGRVFRIESKGIGTGFSGFLRLYTDQFGAVPVPVPPISEQVEVVRYIGNISQEFALAINQVNEEVSLLEELKRVLISEAVTGKIKI